MSLSDTQRIEILISLGCGGKKTRTQKQVCEIYCKYPERRISQSTVSRIENKFHEFGNVTDIPKSGRKRILDDEQKLDILLDIQDNPHKPTRQVAADNDLAQRFREEGINTLIAEDDADLLIVQTAIEKC
ncbi:hypothetical protein NQ318_015305 [Aromia moschata]|uniref:DUF4817 domain-containing protein n=1 Tax=Aromia moschata TaxID=1265417 RepID=A0AAV8XJ80_9CUCU|nr:hypothetical protein NQ318_015305 [Aromia moschata]